MDAATRPLRQPDAAGGPVRAAFRRDLNTLHQRWIACSNDGDPYAYAREAFGQTAGLSAQRLVRRALSYRLRLPDLQILLFLPAMSVAYVSPQAAAGRGPSRASRVRPASS